MRSERGQAVSLFLVVVTTALLIVAGLVIDGGQQSAATRRAHLAAAAAARAGVDATASQRLAGSHVDAELAVRAARASLASDPTLEADISLESGGRLRVTTRISVPTIFLSLIGITRLNSSGTAEAQLYRP